MEGIVTRATYNNESGNVQIGADDDYWIEMTKFEKGMAAPDFVRYSSLEKFD